VTVEHRVRLTFERGAPVEIGCREDEDVITAALRQGLLLLSDCRQGTCGTCRASVEDGEYGTLLDHNPHVLSDREEDEGWVLACCLRPRSSLHLDFDYPADRIAHFDQRLRTAHVVSLERPAPSVARMVIRTLAAQEALAWEPGQYVRLRLTASGVARAYSMANLPTDARELEFFIRLLPRGRVSGVIATMPGPGAAVSIEGPFGAFTLREDGRARVFVAGGTGLAPILAMLRQLARRQPLGATTLIFGVGREHDLLAVAELRRLAAAMPALRIHLALAEPTPGWAGERGTAVDVLDRLTEQSALPAHAYYLCGPPPMVHAARALLDRRGVASGDVYEEQFTSTEQVMP
jgi:methane monooxygenase component C